MIRIKNYILTICIFFLVAAEGLAQCPMCRMAAESNLENGGTAGAGLNTGILYMLAMPYLLVAVLGFVWYRNRKREEIDPLDQMIASPSE